MTKVLPLSQWKKDPPSEREAFSDEDSDEEDSEYEEILIPKKKDVKRKREANEIANSRSIKPNPKLQIRIPKKSVRPAMPNNQAPKNGLGHRWGRQDRLLAHLQSDSNRINRSPHPSLLEDSSRGTNCILL